MLGGNPKLVPRQPTFNMHANAGKCFSYSSSQTRWRVGSVPQKKTHNFVVTTSFKVVFVNLNQELMKCMLQEYLNATRNRYKMFLMWDVALSLLFRSLSSYCPSKTLAGVMSEMCLGYCAYLYWQDSVQDEESNASYTKHINHSCALKEGHWIAFCQWPTYEKPMQKESTAPQSQATTSRSASHQKQQQNTSRCSHNTQLQHQISA